AAHRAETTWLSSRQGLCRPARLYSTPTKRNNAASVAQAVSLEDLPSAIYTPSPSSQHMEGYLRRRPAYTLLPSLRPHDSSSTVNVEWYGDTESQDQLAIMDACLHDLYDVHRAQTIFENLRNS
ncbi:hypothetical protein BDZ89DRAFT_899206, partial [Hymenopellis radicata]